MSKNYDIIVVGAGHAGCEAAMAGARMGLRVALVTMKRDLIAQMSCNPAVGGIAKGHLVREIDALGGIMGEVTDAVGIQFRLLNTSRGPAVWSPRAQCDKSQYRGKMREVLESQPGLEIIEAEVAGLVLENLSPQRTQRDAEGKQVSGFEFRVSSVASLDNSESKCMGPSTSLRSAQDDNAQELSAVSSQLSAKGGEPQRTQRDAEGVSGFEFQVSSATSPDNANYDKCIDP